MEAKRPSADWESYFKRKTLLFNGYGEHVASASTMVWTCAINTFSTVL